MEPVRTGPSDDCLHVDVFLEERSSRAGITELLRSVRPHWRPEDVQLKVFTDGITNQLLGCWAGPESGVVLVRVYGRMTELFVDRKKELEILKLLHSHGCGPRLYCTFQNGMCYEFLKGGALEEPMLHQPSIYRLVASELGRIHSIKPESSSSVEPVLWSKLTNYINLLRSCENIQELLQRDSQIPSLEVLSSEVEDLRKHLTDVGSPTVLCHNDLLTKNIIYNQDEDVVKFIDYEYADFNYQAYDIGNHFNEYAGVNNVDYSLYPSPELQIDWLTHYLRSLKVNGGTRDSGVSQGEVQRLYVEVCKFSLAGHLSWGLWALLQAKYSTIDFDFLRYAAARFCYYFQKKEEYLQMPLH
ncbi:ethanolamine kinase 1 [Trichomycterus rosablanca]|uniref:ethanolamine kinase 1 n=1 Tax=Trichomycterus rosablanca TaxID=2290929 RepID=UPI002F359E96